MSGLREKIIKAIKGNPVSRSARKQFPDRLGNSFVRKLFSEESKKDGTQHADYRSKLANPEDKHPTDNAGLDLREPFFKRFFGDFQGSFLGQFLFMGEKGKEHTQNLDPLSGRVSLCFVGAQNKLLLRLLQGLLLALRTFPLFVTCFSQVSYSLGDEFYFPFRRIFHLKEQYHILKTLSRIFINRVTCARESRREKWSLSLFSEV